MEKLNKTEKMLLEKLKSEGGRYLVYAAKSGRSPWAGMREINAAKSLAEKGLITVLFKGVSKVDRISARIFGRCSGTIRLTTLEMDIALNPGFNIE